MERSDATVRAEISLYYDLYVPDGLSSRAPLIIAVHGYGAHKRYMMREARAVANDRYAIASIQAPHPHYRRTDDGYKIGFGWLSDHRPAEQIAVHHKFVLDVVDGLDTEGVIDRERIYLYGFSQACALNFRFAFTYPGILKGLVGVCGGIPGDLKTNPVYTPFEADTFYLYGSDDEFYTNEQFVTFDSKLAERLPNYRSKQYVAKHEITDEMRGDIRDFLSD